MQIAIKKRFMGITALFFLWIIVLSGCSSIKKSEQLPPEKDVMIQEEEQEAAAVDSTLPANELSSDLLYDLVLAEIALQRNDYNLAFDKYYRAAEQTRDTRLVKKATRVTLFSKNDLQTEKSVKLWSELQPNNLDVQQIYASTLISQKQDEKALIYLRHVIDLSEDYSTGLKRCVAILDTIPERERVDALYAELTKGHDSVPLVHLYAAKIAIKYNDYDHAEKYLNKSLALDPGYLEARIVKVELLKKQKREPEALKLMQEIVADNPENTDFRLELARLLVIDKQEEKAFKHLRILAADEDLSPEMLFAIGLLALEINELDAAKTYLERLHSYRLYASEAAYFIGQLETIRKDYPEAIQWYRRVQDGQYVMDAHLRLALVLSEQGKLNEAVNLLDEYEAANLKQQLEILQIKAEVYAQNEKYKTGYDIYTQALKLSPEDPDLLYGRAMLAEKFGRIDLLEEDLLRIIEANPNDNQALNALGYTLAEQTDRYQEARQYIERALAIDGEDIATLDSMGWVLHKLGNNEEAIKYLQKAYEKDADPEIAAHYGEVLWLLGDTRKAKKVWKKALREHPEHKILLGTTNRYLK